MSDGCLTFLAPLFHLDYLPVLRIWFAILKIKLIFLFIFFLVILGIFKVTKQQEFREGTRAISLRIFILFYFTFLFFL